MNLSKPLIVLFFLSLTVQRSDTQEWIKEEKNSYHVIATSGLNLRSQASLKADIIQKLNYGTAVYAVNDENIKDPITINGHTLDGSWLKFRHEEREGYLYDAYLLPSFRQNFPTERINKDYGLLFPICTCIDNFNFGDDLNWIGVFKNENNAYNAKAVKPTYYRQKAVIGEETCINTNGKEIPLFIIGTKMKSLGLDGAVSRRLIANVEKKDLIKMHENMYFDSNVGQVIYCHENRDMDLSHEELYFTKMIFRGDLNKDGVQDFIIHYGEKSTEIILKMSQLKNGRVSWEDVAVFYDGYCC